MVGKYNVGAEWQDNEAMIHRRMRYWGQVLVLQRKVDKGLADPCGR